MISPIKSIAWAHNSLHKWMTGVTQKKSMCPHNGGSGPKGGVGGAGHDRNQTLPQCLKGKLGQPKRGSKNMEETRGRALVNPKTPPPKDASRDLRLKTPFQE